MSKVIWKYPFGFEIEALVPGELIHVGHDPQGSLCVWSIVNTNEDAVVPDTKVILVATGSRIPEGEWKHLGTFIEDRDFMVHAFSTNTRT